MEQQRQHGYHHHAAAQPGQRAQESGEHGSEADERAEFKDVHCD